jgi:hypothetical protein
MHMWHHVTNHLIISNDKDSDLENRIKLRVRDTLPTSCPLYIAITPTYPPSILITPMRGTN